jgi:hypothetical protein
MKLTRKLLGLAVASAFVAGAGALAFAEECPDPALHNDYPTNTRGDYIYGCMLVNGSGRDVLDKCACSIDVIASVLPYKEYEEAETILAVRQRGGESVAYLYNPTMAEKVRSLKRAQIEGELKCF